MIVETARLTLRPPTADDIDAYAAFRAHPQVTATLPLRFGADGYENATRYVAMFEECAEDTGVSFGELLICFSDEPAFGVGRVGGNVGTCAALSARGAIHIQFRDVNREAE